MFPLLIGLHPLLCMITGGRAINRTIGVVLGWYVMCAYLHICILMLLLPGNIRNSRMLASSGEMF